MCNMQTHKVANTSDWHSCVVQGNVAANMPGPCNSSTEPVLIVHVAYPEKKAAGTALMCRSAGNPENVCGKPKHAPVLSGCRDSATEPG
jgi:hypothetical protein